MYPLMFHLASSPLLISYRGSHLPLLLQHSLASTHPPLSLCGWSCIPHPLTLGLARVQAHHGRVRGVGHNRDKTGLHSLCYQLCAQVLVLLPIHLRL